MVVVVCVRHHQGLKYIFMSLLFYRTSTFWFSIILSHFQTLILKIHFNLQMSFTVMPFTVYCLSSSAAGWLLTHHEHPTCQFPQNINHNFLIME
ncbi:unnamed protein product [Meloidogyne enterolobii]|uniref:Uncharacterized protein n=2 Tax=Meloidogyne enterolobii TaxID=390850 RepID=A0A6V7X582_MELEN|nr:unnamed protein product [Meloidogyne enterolobii]